MELDEQIGERGECAYDTLFAEIVQTRFLNDDDGHLPLTEEFARLRANPASHVAGVH